MDPTNPSRADAAPEEPVAETTYSGDQLQTIIDTIPALTWRSQADGSAELFNARWREYTGMSAEEARSWGWTRALHPGDIERVTDQWHAIVASAKPGELEARLRRSDGEYRWFIFRAAPSLDGHGRVLHWYGTNTDIEDRKRAEETLAASERELRMLFESIPGMIAVNGPANLEYVNQRLLDFVGTDLAALTDLGWAHVLHPDDSDAMVNEWLRCLAAGEPMDVTFRIRRADGVYRWFHTRNEPLFDDQGQVIRWYALLWDIDERKQAELALQLSERDLRLLVDNFPGVVAGADAQGHNEYGNKRLLDFLGKQPADLVERGWLDDVHPEDRDVVLSEWLRCTGSGQPMDLEYRWRRFDGVYRWFHVRAEPLVDEQGTVLRWYSLIIDVDDQKKAQQALRTSQAELAHVTRVATMGELTASIAHEVNQPLTAVVNNANACLGMLPEDVPYLEEIRSALSDVVDDADRASSIIARVRQLARRAPFESILLSLRDVVGDVLALARHESATRRVTIRTELPEDLPRVLGDRVQLQQVLLNLIVNGMDAMSSVEESKRVLTVAARCETREGASEVFLSVRDAGVGFKPDERERLFDTFYTTKAQGMGMGLAISRSIVTAHGGRLWAEPNPGPGATFVFSLPAAANASATPKHPAAR